MNKRKTVFYVFLALWFVNTLSCRLYQLEKKLDPEYQEFLSEVRYIITKEERKIFLMLPDTERKVFQIEFWSRRDPDASTEENEFKDEYYGRIEEANNLFHGGRPGWLQDRGRIYILFGPPTERHTYTTDPSPREIWYYGNFPVIFVDSMGLGNFKLETLNVVYLLELNKAQRASQELAEPLDDLFNFKVKTHINEEKNIVVTIEIDYKDIWLTSIEDRLETTIVLLVELLDVDDVVVLSETKEYPISVYEADLGKQDKIIIEFPLLLKRGTYTLNLELENKAGREKRRKSLRIEARRAASNSEKPNV